MVCHSSPSFLPMQTSSVVPRRRATEKNNGKIKLDSHIHCRHINTQTIWTNRHTNYGQTNTYVTDTTKWTVKMARRNLTTYTNKHTNYMDKQTHKLWTNRHTNYGQTDTQIMDKQTHMLWTQLSGLSNLQE